MIAMMDSNGLHLTMLTLVYPCMKCRFNKTDLATAMKLHLLPKKATSLVVKNFMI